MENKEELARCPFCGGQASFSFLGDKAKVFCVGCFAHGPEFAVSYDICAKDEAIRAWNRRYRE